MACVSVRPQQRFLGVGLVPACLGLPSIVGSALRVQERTAGVFQWEGEMLRLSPLLCLLALHLCFPRDGGGSAASCVGGCPTLHGEAREKLQSVQFYSYAVELKNKKNLKKNFSARASFFILFSVTFAHRHRDAHPSPGAGHVGCPDLEISVNPPTTPREAMPSIEESTLILLLCFSCQGGVKG